MVRRRRRPVAYSSCSARTTAPSSRPRPGACRRSASHAQTSRWSWSAAATAARPVRAARPRAPSRRRAEPMRAAPAPAGARRMLMAWAGNLNVSAGVRAGGHRKSGMRTAFTRSKLTGKPC